MGMVGMTPWFHNAIGDGGYDGFDIKKYIL
jgi:hypothetical protein